MLSKPTCLHIPLLYEESTARLNWEMVDNAQGYELDLYFDEDFQSVLTKRSWEDIDEEGLTCESFEQKSLTWKEFEVLPTQGINWNYFEFLGLTWAGIENKNMSWHEFQRLDSKFTVFRGVGEKVQGPDQGLTWDNVDGNADAWSDLEALQWAWEDFEQNPSIGQCWYQIDHKQTTWEQAETQLYSWHDIENLVPYGLCWSSLEGRWLEWEEIEGKALTWQEIEELSADAKTHISHTVDIPIYKKKAIFRVRAYNDSDNSDYLTTALLNTLPRSLAKYKIPCLHIPELHEGKRADIVYGDLYGAQKFVLERKLGNKEFVGLFDGIGTPVANLNNKKDCKILSKINDVDTHFYFNDNVPLYEKIITYRVKAYNTTDHSQFLQSQPVVVIPVFHREDATTVALIAGKKYMIQLHARSVDELSDIVMNLRFDPTALHLGIMGDEGLSSKTDMAGKSFAGNISEKAKISGEIGFTCVRSIKPNKKWDGLVGVIRFTALRSVSTQIKLS